METTQPLPLSAIPSLLLGLIDRPSHTFRQITRGARWVWVVPLVLLLIGQGLYTAVAAGPAREFGQAVTRYTLDHGRFAGQMTPEQRRQALAQAEAQSERTGSAGLVIGVAGGLLLTLAGWVVYGLIFHALASLLGSQSTTPGAMIAIASWSWLPLGLKPLVQALFVAQTGQLPRHEGLAALVSSGDRVLDSFNPLYAYLGQFDLWQLANWALLIVGVGAISRFSRRKAALVVLPVWLGFSIIALAPLLLGKMVTGL
ncbi:MAG: YIP1 family protein [Ardenticatenaceae bacterium]|nr:YIP1 family protein [Ardenticatenaceae bacterium]